VILAAKLGHFTIERAQPRHASRPGKRLEYTKLWINFSVLMKKKCATRSPGSRFLIGRQAISPAKSGYSWSTPELPNCMIGHLSEHPTTTNSTLASYCSLPTTKVPIIVSMPRVIKPKDEAIRKSELKAKNIQLAVKDYTDPTSGLSLRAAASIYGVSKTSITNHLDK
jgi:hypothetical protein